MKRRMISIGIVIILMLTMVMPVTASAAQVRVDERFISDTLLVDDAINGDVVSINDDVLRIYGENRYETSFMVAEVLRSLLEVERFSSIVVASGTNFPDALSGAYLAIERQAPILLVNQYYVDKVNSYIRDWLAPGGTVYLLGGVNAVPDSVGSGIRGINVKRLGGANRYETNLAILNEAGTAGQNLLICTGKGFADSLSASAAGVPILLVKDRLTDAQRAILANTETKFIIGGESAVSAEIEAELRTYGRVERVGGANRYETSVLVAERTGLYWDGAMLAYAQNFPDGLCGGPLAYYLGIPMMLTATNRESAAVWYAETYGTYYGIVLGGESLISDQTALNIFEASAGPSDPGPTEPEPEPTEPEPTEPAPTEPEHTHSYTETVVLATCTEEGYTLYTCSCGHQYVDDVTPVIPHLIVTETVPPTATEQGYDLHSCLSCGYSYTDNYTDPIPVPEDPGVVDPGTEITEELAYQRMIALKAQYPEGMRWTNDDFYAWNGGIFYGGYGCAGFAFILSDAAFGTLPARMIEEGISIDTVRVGDILRINGDTHSVVILEIYDDYVVLAEGNYNSSIHWGRRYTAAQVAAADYVLTRYPE